MYSCNSCLKFQWHIYTTCRLYNSNIYSTQLAGTKRSQLLWKEIFLSKKTETSGLPESVSIVETMISFFRQYLSITYVSI